MLDVLGVAAIISHLLHTGAAPQCQTHKEQIKIGILRAQYWLWFLTIVLGSPHSLELPVV